jgi:hypothetical protein
MGKLTKGFHSVEMNLTNLSDGYYQVKVIAGNNILYPSRQIDQKLGYKSFGKIIKLSRK